jgi:hypothetical protein
VDPRPPAEPPPEQQHKPPFDRERFIFKTLAVVIGTQLLIYSLAAGVCGQRALQGRPVGQICPGTLEQLQGGFDSTLKLLLALLGGAALSRMAPPS